MLENNKKAMTQTRLKDRGEKDLCNVFKPLSEKARGAISMALLMLCPMELLDNKI